MSTFTALGRLVDLRDSLGSFKVNFSFFSATTATDYLPFDEDLVKDLTASFLGDLLGFETTFLIG